MQTVNAEIPKLLVADFNCFVDEVEMQKTESSKLTFYYFGLLVPTDKPDLEDKAGKILSGIGTEKFHAYKTYRNPDFSIICDGLTDLIIEYKLQTVCFPFVKDWLDSPSLAILKTFEL